MTRSLTTLARTVSRGAPGSKPVAILLDGDLYRTKGTWLREERWSTGWRGQNTGTEDEHLRLVVRLQIPKAGLPMKPLPGAEVRVEGQQLYVHTCSDLGEVYRMELSEVL